MSSVLRFISRGCFALTVAILVVSCKDTKKPKDVLSKAEMIHLLTDIYGAEHKAGKIVGKTDTAKIVFERLKTKIFESRGTTDSIFKKSFDYYVERPKELEEIYTIMIDSVNLKQQQLEASSAQPRKDSIKNDLPARN